LFLELLKDTKIKNAGAGGIPCLELVIQPVDLRAAFENVDESSEVLKVEVVPFLRVCLLYERNRTYVSSPYRKDRTARG
jgi:hypothetical protein